jgi:hypothetical protein
MKFLKNTFKSLIGLSIILGALFIFTKINVDFFYKDKEPSNYLIYMGLILTIMTFNSINNNSNDENNNDNNITNFN